MRAPSSRPSAAPSRRGFRSGWAIVWFLLESARVFAADPLGTAPLASLPLDRVGPESMRYIRVDNALEIRLDSAPRPVPPFGSIVILQHRTLTRVIARGSVLANDGSGLVLKVVVASNVPDPEQLKEALRTNYVARIYLNLEDKFFEAILKGQDLATLILDGMRQNEALELKNAPFWGAAADRLRRELDELRRLSPEEKSEVAGWVRYEQLCAAIEQRIPARYRDGSPFFARQKVDTYLKLRNELRKLAASGPSVASVGGLRNVAEELQAFQPAVDLLPQLNALAAKFLAAGLAADAEMLRGAARRGLVAVVEGFLEQNALWSDAKVRRDAEEALQALEKLGPAGDDRPGPSTEGLRRRLAQVDSVARLRGLLASNRPEEILQGIKDYPSLPVFLQAGISSDLLLAAKAKTDLAERAERALGSSEVAVVQAVLRELDAMRLELTFRKQLDSRLAELRRAAKAKVVAKRATPPAKSSKSAVQPPTVPPDSANATERAPAGSSRATKVATVQFEGLINPPVAPVPGPGSAPVPPPPPDDREALNAARVRLLEEFRSLTTRVRAGLSIGNAPVANYWERLNQFAKDLAAIAPRLEALREGGPVYSAELRSLTEIVGTAINSFTEFKRMCDGLEAQLQGLGAGQGFRPEYVRQVEQEAVALRTRLGPFFTLNPPFRESLDDLVRRVKEREIVRKAPAPKRIL
jgi:hypothetical protein